MIETDPVLVAFKNYEAMRDAGVNTDEVWKIFVLECERVMREKVKKD